MERCFYGAYEKEYLYLFRDIVAHVDQPVFWDVGANTGHNSLFMGQYCAAVHAFEPNPFVRNKLEDKIKKNAINNIDVHGVALGEKTKFFPFCVRWGQ